MKINLNFSEIDQLLSAIEITQVTACGHSDFAEDLKIKLESLLPDALNEWVDPMPEAIRADILSNLKKREDYKYKLILHESTYRTNVAQQIKTLNEMLFKIDPAIVERCVKANEIEAEKDKNLRSRT